MKNLVIGVYSLLMLSFISTSVEVKALTFEKLPIVQKSNQWSVKVGEPKLESNLVKTVKGKYNLFSLKIHKIGSNVDSVKVNLYRNEPNSKTKYSLSGCPPNHPCNKEENIEKIPFDLAKQMNDGYPYVFENFPLTVKATELEVEVVWTENNEGRPMKETFIFADK